ncbi:MAG: MarR family winged helix-turn-helix transcriptional regulator [Parasphingorhabdus sp.]|uniref:MarR family winged helix-turn-helix transcriptional regulator n=1 Tax=Parasphingorhabdus sp. TaxID=2709688 RepID=UPI00329A3592
MNASQLKIYFLIQRTAHVLKKRADADLVESGGMSTAQAAVMAIVASENGVSQRHLADKLKQRESAITTMANRLLKAGYISRTRSDTDGRAWILKSTNKGQSALEKVSKSFAEVNAIIDDAFPSDQFEPLAAGLHTILEKLGERDNDNDSALP